MLNGLDLFSGHGGFTIGLSAWVRPVAYCEIDRYAQSVLLSRMANGRLPRAPIWDDVSSLDVTVLPIEIIDIIYGGFPCQDISSAGLRAGLEGKRSGLFREIVRLAEEISPSFIFLENVAAIRTRGLSTVVQELSYRGYECRWKIISAQEIGAPHLRKRLFLLAYAKGKRGGVELQDISRENAEKERSKIEYQNKARFAIDADWWKTEPCVGRVDDGTPLRVDRNRALGNGVVPAQAKEAFQRLMGLK